MFRIAENRQEEKDQSLNSPRIMGVTPKDGPHVLNSELNSIAQAPTSCQTFLNDQKNQESNDFTVIGSSCDELNTVAIRSVNRANTGIKSRFRKKMGPAPTVELLDPKNNTARNFPRDKFERKSNHFTSLPTESFTDYQRVRTAAMLKAKKDARTNISITRSPRNTINTFREGNSSSIFDMPPSNGTLSSYNIPYQRPFSTKIMSEKDKPSDPLGVYLRQPIASRRPVMTPDGSLRNRLLNNNKPALPSRKNLTSCKPR